MQKNIKKVYKLVCINGFGRVNMFPYGNKDGWQHCFTGGGRINDKAAE